VDCARPLDGREIIEHRLAGEKTKDHFAAIQAGMEKNYKLMEKIFAEIIERSLAAS